VTGELEVTMTAQEQRARGLLANPLGDARMAKAWHICQQKSVVFCLVVRFTERQLAYLREYSDAGAPSSKRHIFGTISQTAPVLQQWQTAAAPASIF
jgi:hypothetical protein